ncbi:MAG: response regulator [Magnetococcales bacterium]|nr:response regulator [Magnetococcales bacterium]
MSGEVKPQILIVDDVPGNIKTLAAILSEDYNIIFSTNGADALEKATEKKIDLILLDISMPGMDGYEVCRRLKKDENTSNIPVIFVTAKQETFNETMGFEVGASDYITKPISPPVVKVRIQTQLQNRALNNSLEQSNQFIRKTFGRYMSNEVVESILDTPEGLRLGGERKLVTAMMSDLRGFTAIGERFSPEEVISMLNMYLETMTEVILKYQGTIIEFLGDGILALFGAPITRENDADRAMACVLEMQMLMPVVNKKFREKGFEEVAMGCGVNTGYVIAGNIGSDLRSKYGVVGNAINLTGRIESFTVGGQILISENTMEACSAKLRVDDQWLVRAKGVEHPITVYHIGGIDGPYNIQLEKQDIVAPKTIENGFAVRLTVIEGKRANQRAFDGRITALVPPLLFIKTELSARRLTNLQLELIDKQGTTITNQLYGKVVATQEGDGCLKVQMTSTPPEASKALAELL